MKQIPLSRGKFAIVDDQDFEWLNQWKWCADKGGNTFYAKRTVYLGGGRTNYRQARIYMHRLILNAPKGRHTDHINGNGLDNLRSNLRLCTNQQNRCNQRLQAGIKTSRFKGVSLTFRKNKWQTYIQNKGKNLYLGCFDSEIDAAKAYDNKAKELFGEFARLNFPNEQIA